MGRLPGIMIKAWNLELACLGIHYYCLLHAQLQANYSVSVCLNFLVSILGITPVPPSHNTQLNEITHQKKKTTENRT